MPDRYNEIALTTYTARKITDYTDSEDMQGPTLLAAFKEDFEDWNEARFNLVHKEYRRSLRLLLRKRGIYTGNLLGKIAPQLSQLLDIEDLPEWHEIDSKDFMRMRFDEETYALRLREKLESTPTNSPPAATPTPKPTPRLTPPPATAPAAPTAPAMAPPAPTPPAPATMTTTVATMMPVNLDWYTRIISYDFPNESADPDIQQRFAKIWNRGKTHRDYRRTTPSHPRKPRPRTPRRRTPRRKPRSRSALSRAYLLQKFHLFLLRDWASLCADCFFVCLRVRVRVRIRLRLCLRAFAFARSSNKRKSLPVWECGVHVIYITCTGDRRSVVV